MGLYVRFERVYIYSLQYPKDTGVLFIHTFIVEHDAILMELNQGMVSNHKINKFYINENYNKGWAREICIIKTCIKWIMKLSALSVSQNKE